MSIKKPHSYLLQIGVLLAVGFMLSALLALIVNLLFADDELYIMLSLKLLLSLANTFLFSLGVILLGLLIAIPAASILVDIEGRKGEILRLLAVAPLVVPPYIHALAWQQWFGSLGLTTSGDMVALWVEALARLPLLLAATLVGYVYLNPTANSATRIYANPSRAFLYITLPQLKPSIIVGSAIVFIFSINEYSLPALFLRSSYALDIFAQYSATGNSREVLLMALPLVLLSVTVVVIAINSISNLPTPTRVRREQTRLFAGPLWFDIWRIVALLITMLQLVIPLKEIISLVLFSDSTITKSAIESLQYSTTVALTASLFVLPFAWFLAEYLHRYSNPLVWFAILIGFALPPSLIGVGTILFWGGDGLDRFFDGQLLLIIGYMTRILPLSTLLIYIVIRNSDASLWDAARLYQHGFKLWLKIRLYQVRSGILGALLVSFSITLPDLELSLLLSPAGMTTIGVRLFNYLHYGAAEQVSYLSLLILLTTLLFGAGLYLVITNQIGRAKQKGKNNDRAKFSFF